MKNSRTPGWRIFGAECRESAVGAPGRGAAVALGVSQGRDSPGVIFVTPMGTEPSFSLFWFYRRGTKPSEQAGSVSGEEQQDREDLAGFDGWKVLPGASLCCLCCSASAFPVYSQAWQGRSFVPSLLCLTEGEPSPWMPLR